MKKEYALYCDIIDETGAIATIATILSIRIISVLKISALSITVNSTEGVLKIDFYDQDAQKEAADQLGKRNYIIYER